MVNISCLASFRLIFGMATLSPRATRARNSRSLIEKHYGKYLGGDSEEQLNRLLGAESETLSATFGTPETQKQDQPEEIIKKGESGPTWIRTRDRPVMSRWL